MVRRAIFQAEKLMQIVMLVILAFSFTGCGVKGPPVPPKSLPLPMVADLAYQVHDRAVTLTWRLTGRLSGKQAEHASFGVYRSRTALAEPACEGCPLVFEKVAEVPYAHADADRFSIDAPLDSGYRHVFKVRLEAAGTAGPDSKPVQVDH